MTASRLLASSEKLFRALFNNIGDSIFIVDVTGEILDANKTACQRLGYGYDELLKLSVLDFNNPSELGSISDGIKRVIDSGFSTFDTYHVSKNGETFPV